MNNKELLKEIVNLGIDLNFKDDNCVFIILSGHIDTLEISIRKNKEEFSKKLSVANIKLQPYNNLGPEYKKDFESNLNKQLLHVRNTLKNYIKGGKLDDLSKDMPKLIEYIL